MDEGIEKVSSKNKDAAELIKSFHRTVKGRPQIEVNQSVLLTTIVDII